MAPSAISRLGGDVDEMLREMNTNALSCDRRCSRILGNYFEQQRSGCICVISSVAGDRGRGSNYVYGSAKAALTAFYQRPARPASKASASQSSRSSPASSTRR